MTCKIYWLYTDESALNLLQTTLVAIPPFADYVSAALKNIECSGSPLVTRMLAALHYRFYFLTLLCSSIGYPWARFYFCCRSVHKLVNRLLFR